jgi:hypothetical protein
VSRQKAFLKLCIYCLKVAQFTNASSDHQGRDLENAFEAGPSSSSGQQEGREVSFKGVGTFQVDANNTDRLLRRDRRAEKVSFHFITEANFQDAQKIPTR